MSKSWVFQCPPLADTHQISLSLEFWSRAAARVRIPAAVNLLLINLQTWTQQVSLTVWAWAQWARVYCSSPKMTQTSICSDQVCQLWSCVISQLILHQPAGAQRQVFISVQCIYWPESWWFVTVSASDLSVHQICLSCSGLWEGF